MSFALPGYLAAGDEGLSVLTMEATNVRNEYCIADIVLKVFDGNLDVDSMTEFIQQEFVTGTHVSMVQEQEDPDIVPTCSSSSSSDDSIDEDDDDDKGKVSHTAALVRAQMLCCGHNLCFGCLKRVVECPLCKGPPTRVGPNIAVRNLISNQTAKCGSRQDPEIVTVRWDIISSKYVHEMKGEMKRSCWVLAGVMQKKALEAIMNSAYEPRDKTQIIILAGYQEHIEQVFALNPGFRSRFHHVVTFSPKEVEQLAEILLLKIQQSYVRLDGCGLPELKEADPETRLSLSTSSSPRDSRPNINDVEKTVRDSHRVPEEMEWNEEERKDYTEQRRPYTKTDNVVGNRIVDMGELVNLFNGEQQKHNGRKLEQKMIWVQEGSSVYNMRLQDHACRTFFLAS
ncbi:hypothetical protein Bbelb_351060 [Branchiostoma belcheri]|nr:hypothetical protein Bbelb_351060 [Branchiostoma belcheri]